MIFVEEMKKIGVKHKEDEAEHEEERAEEEHGEAHLARVERGGGESSTARR